MLRVAVGAIVGCAAIGAIDLALVACRAQPIADL